MFRLGHLHTKAEDGAGHEVEMESVRLLQTRLDRIKKRHDELEPRTTMETGEIDAAGLTPAEGGIARSRSTITMVTDSPQTGTVAKAERLLGLGLGQDVEDGGKRIGKAASWLKKSFGTKKKRNSGSLPVTPEIGGSRSPSIDGASPVLSHTSPVIPYDSPALQQSPKPLSSPALLWPASRSSNEWSNGSLPPTDARKTRPPDIVTSSPGIAAPASAGSFKFEFELPTVSPRSDTFDPTPTPSSPRRNSQPPSPRQPTSPHMSRSFSKRSSLLPPPTASALEAAVSPKVQSPLKPVHEEGYDQKLHAYAIRMLAELEDAQKEVRT